jgi:diguanylate cyclase (GGDEF)-like protein/PAS domain S-box-containing protein
LRALGGLGSTRGGPGEPGEIAERALAESTIIPVPAPDEREAADQKRAIEAPRLAEDSYRLLFDHSPQPMWVYDVGTLRFVAVNQAAVDRYGYPRERFAELTVADLRLEDDVALDDSGAEGAGAAGHAIRRHRTARGELIDVEITAHALTLAGRESRLVIAADVTERLRVEQKLWHAAFYDALTGLPNRALFMERLGQAQARARGRSGNAFAVLFLDLDRFKVVNDSLGHRAGDQLLVAIARRLDRIRRAGDTVARLGGDEFGFLIEGADDAAAAGRVADRVQREVCQPFDIGGQEVFTSASIGIALGGTNEHRPEDLLRDADTAMYRAKALGVARYAVFDVSMHDHAVARMQMETDLRRAVERGELRVHYQPVVALQSARITGFEALARWQHPVRGLIAPREFISLAEDTGVIGALGRWVLLEACRHVRALQLAHPQDLTLGVNVSGRQILQADFVEQIRHALDQTGFPANLLRLELTETVLLENEAAASRCLQALRQMGVKLAIDDFGTGYSSLMWLHRMPVDVLKIDASFVAGMADDDRNRRIVDAILSLGRNLGVEVIAEGVETAQQAQALYRLGCGAVQGFLFSEPLEPADAARLLARESPFALLARKLHAN